MKKVTNEELEQILINELAKVEGCKGVRSIGFYKVIEPDLPNWTTSIINFGEADESLCLSALPKIVQRLLGQYELK